MLVLFLQLLDHFFLVQEILLEVLNLLITTLFFLQRFSDLYFSVLTVNCGNCGVAVLPS